MKEATREPKIAHQPFTEVVTTGQYFNVSCRALMLRNLGTCPVVIDDLLPMAEGDVHQEAATWDGVLCYRMKITFAPTAEGQTQNLLIRQICDIGQIAPNQ